MSPDPLGGDRFWNPWRRLNRAAASSSYSTPKTDAAAKRLWAYIRIRDIKKTLNEFNPL